MILNTLWNETIISAGVWDDIDRINLDKNIYSVYVLLEKAALMKMKFVQNQNGSLVPQLWALHAHVP